MPAAEVRVQYGTDSAQFGDLYLPAGMGPHPVVVLIHGGCWRAMYDLAPLGSLCRALTGLGIAVWNLEYRRVGNGGGWPATFADVGAGADYLRRLAADYPLDLRRVIAAGHSAGGHLALWLAARRRLPSISPVYCADPLQLRGVLSLAGLADLAQAVARDLCGGMVVELLGGTPEVVPDRYQQASPHALLPLGVPQVLITGMDDDVVAVDFVSSYAAAAAELGDAVQPMIMPDVGHFEPVMSGSAAWPTVRDAVLQLLG
ncbi:MAG: alpha/beta hydrolase [Caldilineaceae bacterium]|nr:alpha/beta hydrolase [Caldilineaceae bacterium]